MKYCKKCGTLLEDTQEICIGCGTDVTIDENVSLYPQQMEKTIIQEKNNQKKRSGLIVMIILIFAVLIALIIVSVIMVKKSAENQTSMPEPAKVEAPVEEETVETAEPESESLLAEEINADAVIDNSTANETTEATPSDKTVKDDKGSYYKIDTLADSAGNTIFSTIYPEDFQLVGQQVDYDGYSLRYPVSFTYIVSDEDNTVKFTYFSSKHFWYRNSDNGKTRNNERDIFNYMTYYTYDGVRSYLDALLNASYKDKKKMEFIEKVSIGEQPETTLKEVSDKHTMTLTGEIGDYAKIGEDTEYAAMAAECEAAIYKYQITSRQDNIIYVDIYAPVIANTLSYSTSSNNDKGEVVEWVMPCVAFFESGSEEYYNQYADAFKLFISNSKPTREFFYDNYNYAAYLTKCINEETTLTGLNQAKLKEYHSKYTKDSDIGEYNEGVYKFLNTYPAENSLFKNSTEAFSTPGAMKVGYLNKTDGKLFISPDETEYPGDKYEELEATVGSENSPQGESQEADQEGTS